MRRKLKAVLIAVVAAVVLGAVVFALVPGSERDVTSVSIGEADGHIDDASGAAGSRSAAQAPGDGKGEDFATAPSKDESGGKAKPSAEPTPKTVIGSPSGGSDLGPVDDVMDTLEEAEQEVVDEVTEQLGGVVPEDVDLEEVTDDVAALVEDGVPLEEAVETVLGLLGPIVPVPTASPTGVVGGLLGG